MHHVPNKLKSVKWLFSCSWTVLTSTHGCWCVLESLAGSSSSLAIHCHSLTVGGRSCVSAAWRNSRNTNSSKCLFQLHSPSALYAQVSLPQIFTSTSLPALSPLWFKMSLFKWNCLYLWIYMQEWSQFSHCFHTNSDELWQAKFEQIDNKLS